MHPQISNNYQSLINTLPESVDLVAVTKYATDTQVQSIIDAGARKLGESKIQNAEIRIPKFSSPNLEWHLIGHLQRNKVKKAIQLFDVIQSVDSLRLLEKINLESSNIGKKQKILLQINLSGEPQKHGFEPNFIQNSHLIISALNHVSIQGIMMMAPHLSDRDALQEFFQSARGYFESVKKDFPAFSVLSMGMSNDFELAIKEGSTMVRVGSYLFKEETT